jgi:hypothetical protein
MAETVKAAESAKARQNADELQAPPLPLAGMRVEITFAGSTVDQFWEDLGKLRQVGWGSADIEWHTSRSHLGKQITMALMLDRAAKTDRGPD